MVRPEKTTSAVLVMLCLALPGAVAGLRDVNDGTLVDDFEDGSLNGWETDAEHVEVEKEGTNTVLELGANSRFANLNKIMIKDKPLRDFSIEVLLRKHQFSFMDLGVTFRKGCQVIFRRRPGVLVVLTSDGKGVASAYQPGFNLAGGYHRLKVVCAGPIVRVFVDGVPACHYGHLPVDAGLVGLCTARGRACFDDVQLQTSVPEEEYLDLEPQVEDPSLVFPPDKPLTLRFQVSNHADAPKVVNVGLEVRTWNEQWVKGAVAGKVRVEGNGQTTVSFSLGLLPEGYYKMVLTPGGKMYPLAIQHRGPGLHELPTLNIGVYWYHQIDDMEPIWKHTYMHAAARDLVRHGFNTVVMGGAEKGELTDILAQYGIGSITRGGSAMDRPGVIGTFVGDEPGAPQDVAGLKEQYLKIRESHQGKFITTNIVCDDGISSFQEQTWKELVPIGGIRICRWYNMKKCYFGPDRRYAQRPSFTEFLAAARTAHASPYWPLVNTFGPEELGPDDYFGFPTGSQLTAAMHLTFAYEGKGFLCFTYQPPGTAESEQIGLVHALSLVPFRDVWDAVGEAALSISQHAKLIQSLKWGGVPPWCDKREIEMVALQDGEQNPYFYVVNTDAVETVNFRLMNLDPENKVEDLYARQVLDIYPERVELHHGVRMDTGVLRLTLRPGEGKLLRYLAAKPTTGLRVKYPEWVEKTPEGKCQYLIDLRAENVPQPDWLPAKKGWGELNGDTKLYTSKRDAGRDYKKALYAHAETEIVYTVPDGYTHFVAAAGFGDPGVPRGSVVFRVLVDGKERFRSESYTLSPVLPIVVDVKGAKRLELVTEDAGDGIYHDYVWWAEARLIRE